MAKEQTSVPDIFRRAQALMREQPGMSLKELRSALYREFNGSPMPSLHNVTIPEQDARAPEEDWSPALVVAAASDGGRDIATASRASTSRSRARARLLGASDDWHDRDAGIEVAIHKGSASVCRGADAAA